MANPLTAGATSDSTWCGAQPGSVGAIFAGPIVPSCSASGWLRTRWTRKPAATGSGPGTTTTSIPAVGARRARTSSFGVPGWLRRGTATTATDEERADSTPCELTLETR
jgi:hypothetical protein